MGTVLVRLPSGEGVVRRDEDVLVTHDVAGGGGTYLRDEDPYEPTHVGLDGDRSLVGGLLPPGAVSAEVVDDARTRVQAAIGDGAYAAILAQGPGGEPVVCCRDADGALVRRPLPADYPSTPVTDAAEACPACGAVDYDERTPHEQWRGGRVNPDGTTTPNPIVVCRACGHREQEGTFYGALTSDLTDENDAAREARLARARAEHRLQRWYSDTMTIRAATFPIYAAEGWPALVAGSGSRGGEQTSITIRHHATAQPDPFEAEPAWIEVTTSRDLHGPRDDLREARQALGHWVQNDGRGARWPDASRGAITLWLRARAREVRAVVLSAERSETMITIDGTREPFLTLTAPGRGWVAVRRHSDLTVTVAGRDVDPSALTIEPVADPAARLLGPRPPDPDAA